MNLEIKTKNIKKKEANAHTHSAFPHLFELNPVKIGSLTVNMLASFFNVQPELLSY